MEEALTLAGLKNLEIMLPDRFVDGYGMSPRLITRAKEQGITLVVTVDCGSRNHEIIDELAIRSPMRSLSSILNAPTTPVPAHSVISPASASPLNSPPPLFMTALSHLARKNGSSI